MRRGPPDRSGHAAHQSVTAVHVSKLVAAPAWEPGAHTDTGSQPSGGTTASISLRRSSHFTASQPSLVACSLATATASSTH